MTSELGRLEKREEKEGEGKKKSGPVSGANELFTAGSVYGWQGLGSGGSVSYFS